MYRKTLIAGATAAAIVGAGGTALAVSGSDSSGTPAANTARTDAAGHPLKRLLGNGKLLRRLAHGQIVVRGKDGFVTHDLIAGTVTSVSATSITVLAADKTSETFTVTKDTKVRMRSNGSGAASTIEHVADGDHVLVAGTGSGTLTAKHVLDVKK